MAEQQGLTALLCSYAASLQYEDLPPKVISTAKRLVLDSLGAALAGTTMGDGCRETLAVVRASGGVPESSVLGTGEKTSAVMASLANGATVHALNYDAIGARGGHPGAFGLTAPLAVAERVGKVNGKEFIASLVAGVEVEMRAVVALIEAGVDTRQNFLEGQVLSYVGATLSAGRVLRLNPEQMDSALGLMLMQVSGTRQVVLYGDPPSKGIYAAFPNQGGVLSALMAKEGLEGRCLAIEGQAGLFNMFYNGVYAPKALRDGLGERFHILETVFKPWATSGMCHPFIDAALKLREAHNIDPRQVQQHRLQHCQGPYQRRGHLGRFHPRGHGPTRCPPTSGKNRALLRPLARPAQRHHGSLHRRRQPPDTAGRRPLGTARKSSQQRATGCQVPRLRISLPAASQPSGSGKHHPDGGFLGTPPRCLGLSPMTTPATHLYNGRKERPQSEG